MAGTLRASPVFMSRDPKPYRAPLPWRRWRPILKGVWDEMTVDNVDILSGGIAFFAALSLFPTLALLVLLYGLVGDPSTLEAQLNWITGSLVPSARDILRESLDLAASQKTSLSVGAVVAFLVAIWSASRATNALLLSVQVAYDDEKNRSFLKQTGLTIVLTLILLVALAVALASLGAAPGWIEQTGLSDTSRFLVAVLRWPLLWLGAFVGLTQIYRFAPNKRQGPRRWVAPGALVATLLWTLVSAGFNFYSATFANYESTYGALATVVVFLTWLFLSAQVLIIGAELNAEIEKHSPANLPTTEEEPANGSDRAIESSHGKVSHSRHTPLEGSTRPLAGLAPLGPSDGTRTRR